MKEKHTYQHSDTPGHLPEGLRVNPYTVPDGYFENLSQQTLRKCRDGEPAQGSWGVPDGYFEQLTDSITAKIAEQKLKALVSEPGFTVPDGYFEGLGQLLAAEGKLRGKVAGAGFTVPQGYFDTLPDRIGEQTQQRPATPVRRMAPLRWVAYAAASIALVFGLAGIFRSAVSDHFPETQQSLASVPDQQILDYLELYGSSDDMMYISEQMVDFDEQQISTEISDEDIEAYLNLTL